MKVTLVDGNVIEGKPTYFPTIGYIAKTIEMQKGDFENLLKLVEENRPMAMETLRQLEERFVKVEKPETFEIRPCIPQPSPIGRMCTEDAWNFRFFIISVLLTLILLALLAGPVK